MLAEFLSLWLWDEISFHAWLRVDLFLVAISYLGGISKARYSGLSLSHAVLIFRAHVSRLHNKVSRPTIIQNSLFFTYHLSIGFHSICSLKLLIWTFGYSTCLTDHIKTIMFSLFQKTHNMFKSKSKKDSNACWTQCAESQASLAYPSSCSNSQ